MSYLKLVDEATVKEIAKSQTTNPGLQEINKHKRQEEFLSVFERCLSLKVAASRVNIDPTTFRYWKKTDADFAKRLNAILEDWQQELVGAAVSKAMGYTRIDPETGEEEVDGSGKVIRYNADGPLLKYFMEKMNPEVNKTSPVSISINVGSFYGEPEAIEATVIEEGYTEADFEGG